MISYIYKISCFDRFTFKFCNLLKRLKLFKTYITCFQEPSSTLPKQNVWTDAIFILMQFSHPPRFFCMICCKYRTGYISSTIFIYIYRLALQQDIPLNKKKHSCKECYLRHYAMYQFLKFRFHLIFPPHNNLSKKISLL